MMQYTQEQILKLAPDSSSASAGKKLATPAKWLTSHAHAEALWGECQGSGKNPYKTSIDLKNIAFKCSCPSRKFPCKHGIGLLLLYAQNPAVFKNEENLNPEVQAWLDKRNNRDEAQKTKKDKPIDEAAQQKRIQAREKKVKAGIEELQTWLKDVVRAGIMAVPQNQYQFTQKIAARMIDAQAGGLANQLRAVHKINFYNEGWQTKLLRQLAKVYALSEAYLNQHQLPNALKEDVRSLVGWNTAKEEVLSQDALTDDWWVLAQQTEVEERLSIEQTWLYGLTSQRFALLLNFYAPSQKPTEIVALGTCLEADMCFYPSAMPLRALIKDLKNTKKQDLQTKPTGLSVLQAHHQISNFLAILPFVEEIPLLLSAVRLHYQAPYFQVVDAEQHSLTLSNEENECWQMLAITKSLPFTCFGLYVQGSFKILTLITEEKSYSL